MDDARQAKKPRIKSRPSTPDTALQTRRHKSASGWGLEDLRNCSVEVVQDVAPVEMIPEKFFDFARPHLKKYSYGFAIIRRI